MEKFFASILSEKGKIASLIELSRPWNGIVLGLISLIGLFYISTSFLQPLTIFSVFFTFLIIYMAGTTLNDICDIETDKINMPYRPLQTTRISIKEAYRFTIFLYLISFLIAFLLSYSFLLIVLVFALFTILYSVPPVSLVRRGLIGNFTLGLVTVLLPALGGGIIATNRFILPLNFWLTFVSLTIFFSFVTVLKDFKDIKGDKLKGKKTFVIQVGKKKAFIISVVGTTVFFILTIFFFGMVFQSIIFYIISTILLTLLLYTELQIRKPNQEEEVFGHVRIIVFIFMLVILGFVTI